MPDTPDTAMQSPVRAALLMLAASALVALSTLLAKALGQGLGGAPLHPLQISAGRFVFALLALSVFVPVLRPSFRGANWRRHILRSVCGWGGVTCMFAAAAVMPLAEATAISFLSPLVAMVLAIPLLGERIGPIRWAAAFIAIIGALILIRPGTAAFHPAALLALTAALVMGFEAIVIKGLTASEPPMRILVINNAIGTLVAGTVAIWVWSAPAPQQWLLLAGVGVSMVCGQVCFLGSMRRADASYVMPFFYATLVFASLYDLTLFGVIPETLSLIGAATIVGAAITLAWRESVARRRHPAPR